MKEQTTPTSTTCTITPPSLGIDWADKKHALATLVASFEAGAAPEASELEQKTDVFLDWISSLHER